MTQHVFFSNNFSWVFRRKWTTLHIFLFWDGHKFGDMSVICPCHSRMPAVATKEKQNRRKRKKRAWRLRHWVQLGLFLKKSLKQRWFFGRHLQQNCIFVEAFPLYIIIYTIDGIHYIINIFVCLSLFRGVIKKRSRTVRVSLTEPWCHRIRWLLKLVLLDGCLVTMLWRCCDDATTEVVVPVVAVPAALMVERLEASNVSVNRWSCHVFRTVWLILLQHPFVLERCSSNGRSSREASPTFHRKVRSSSEQEVDQCLTRHPNRTFGSFKIP